VGHAPTVEHEAGSDVRPAAAGETIAVLTISRGDGFRSGPVLRRRPAVVLSLAPGAAVATPVTAIVVAFPLGDVWVEVVGSAEAVTLLVALRGGKLATLVGLHLPGWPAKGRVHVRGV